MYTEGFDELSEAGNRPPRTYVSAGGQEVLKLQREIERLKKSLEKEQFFNKLLDQELKDLKSGNGEQIPQDYYRSARRPAVSRSNFNALLVITILLAGLLAYFAWWKPSRNVQGTALNDRTATAPVDATPVVTDSVPNIIAEKSATGSSRDNGSRSNRTPSTEIKDANAKNKMARTEAEPEQVTEDDAVPAEAAPVKPAKAAPVAAAPAKQSAAAPVSTQPVAAQAASTQPAAAQPSSGQPASTQRAANNQPAATSKSVVGRYVVTSKANFYSAPDDNTLRSYFISPGNDKVVNALDDRNGFIYVEFKNDVGYVTKGWLSKADLTRQ